VKIDLTELLHKIGNEADVEISEKVSYPADDLNLTKPVKMNLHLVNAGTQVIMEGTIISEAELSCSRCLGKFKQPVSVEIKEAFAKDLFPSGSKKGKELELYEQDFISPIEKDNSIDISEVIRQNLLLALPIKALCNKKCQGLKG